MKAMIDRIEKMKPLFEKISNNSYLRAIRDGFISLIPVILFSSFFLLVMSRMHLIFIGTLVSKRF